MKFGDYVVGAKYRDGDPGDPWCVGFYSGRRMLRTGAISYSVVGTNWMPFCNCSTIRSISKECGK